MSSKPLTETNRYLKDPVQREKLNRISARTSCGVEGIQSHEDNEIIRAIPQREKPLFKKLKAKFTSG